jgi:hypothetical protein
MPFFTYSVRAYLNVVESGADWQSTVDRAANLIFDYEISPNEIGGYNGEAGTAIRTISAIVSKSESTISRSTRKATSARVAVQIDVELGADDEDEARRVGRDALTFYDLSPFFLAAYNEGAGTRFTGFAIEDLDESTVSPLEVDELQAA